MKLVVDASVDYPLVALLRDARFDVTSVREVDPRMTDAAVLRLAVAEGAALITADKDFGELAFHRGLQNDGVVLLRLGGLTLGERLRLAESAIRQVATETKGRFVVVSPGQIRMRKMQ